MSVKIMTEVWERTPLLTSTEKILLLVMADSANDDYRTMWLSMPTMMRKAALAQTSAYRALRKLLTEGYIEDVEESLWPEEAKRYKSVVRKITEPENWPSSNYSQNDTPATVGDNPSTTQLQPPVEIPSVSLLPVPRIAFAPDGTPSQVHPRPVSRAMARRAAAEAADLADNLADPFTVLAEPSSGPAEALNPGFGHMDSSRPEIGPQKGTQSPAAARSLALKFRDQSMSLGWGLGPTNVAALASHFAAWKREGVTSDTIQQMINLFIADPGMHDTRVVPWKDFLAKRQLLLSKVTESDIVQEREDHKDDASYWLDTPQE